MKERWAVEVHWGNGKQGGRTHIITLSNKEAVDKFVGAVQDGVIPWDDVLEVEDCRVFEENDLNLV